MALTWERNKKYYVSSACGVYNVSKALVDNDAVYTAWRNKTDRHGVVCLGMYDTPKEAKERCEHHNQTGN